MRRIGLATKYGVGIVCLVLLSGLPVAHAQTVLGTSGIRPGMSFAEARSRCNEAKEAFHDTAKVAVTGTSAVASRGSVLGTAVVAAVGGVATTVTGVRAYNACVNTMESVEAEYAAAAFEASRGLCFEQAQAPCVFAPAHGMAACFQRAQRMCTFAGSSSPATVAGSRDGSSSGVGGGDRPQIDRPGSSAERVSVGTPERARESSRERAPERSREPRETFGPPEPPDRSGRGGLDVT